MAVLVSAPQFVAATRAQYNTHTAAAALIDARESANFVAQDNGRTCECARASCPFVHTACTRGVRIPQAHARTVIQSRVLMRLVACHVCFLAQREVSKRRRRCREHKSAIQVRACMFNIVGSSMMNTQLKTLSVFVVHFGRLKDI